MHKESLLGALLLALLKILIAVAKHSKPTRRR